MKIKFYSDPGHGWAAVKRKLIDELGIADRISRFSFQRGDTVYLEEDCDMPALVTQLALKGIVVDWQHRQSDRRSPIRSYQSFSAHSKD